MSKVLQNRENILSWVEKYRPRNFSQFVGNQDIVRDLLSMIQENSIPHLLFSGMQGVGKTTAAMILMDMLYGKDKRRKYIEINASDDNSINTVRTLVKDYAKTSGSSQTFTKSNGVQYRVIILDEADNLTPQAQAALRRVMERYSKYCKFILICNYKHKIIPAVQSRCSMFDFKPISPEEMVVRLEQICVKENVKITKEAVEYITELVDGDIRTAINTYLERLKLSKSTVNIEHIRHLDLYEPIATEVIKDSLNGWFIQARQIIYKGLRQGINLRELLKRIGLTAANLKMADGTPYPDYIIAQINLVCLKCDYYITQGVYPHILIGGLIAKLMNIGME